MLDKKTHEIMVITQEEAAEVIQAVSKILRFGLDDCHPATGISNTQSLETELGDLMCMLELLSSTGIVDMERVHMAKEAKIAKLKIYSNIFE